MIAKTRKDIKNVSQNRTITESYNGSNNKQWINNRTTILKRTAVQATGVGVLDSAVVEVQEMFFDVTCHISLKLLSYTTSHFGSWLGRCNRPEFPPSQFFSPGKEWAGPFFPRGKNRPAHSFPTQSVFSPPTNNFKNHNGIIISLYKFKKPLLN